MVASNKHLHPLAVAVQETDAITNVGQTYDQKELSVSAVAHTAIRTLLGEPMCRLRAGSLRHALHFSDIYIDLSCT